MEKDLVVTEIICIFALRIKTLSVMSKKYKKIAKAFAEHTATLTPSLPH